MVNPKVSVVIPVYNAESYLQDSLNSILNQTFTDIEVICVDDGSNDSSADILTDYAKQDDRVLILSQPHQYAGVARNKGLEIARGEYILFFDADDFSNTTLIEKAYKRAKVTGDVDIVLFGGQRYDNITGEYLPAQHYLNRALLPNKDVFYRKDIPDNFLLITSPCPWSKLFRREFILREGLRFQTLQNSNDVFFVFCALSLAETISWVDEDLVYYRINQSGSTQSTKDKNPTLFLKAYEAIYEKLCSKGIYNDVEKSFINVVLSSLTYVLDTVENDASRIKIYKKLLNSSLIQAGLLNHTLDYYTNKIRAIRAFGAKYIVEWHEKFIISDNSSIQALLDYSEQYLLIVHFSNIKEIVRSKSASELIRIRGDFEKHLSKLISEQYKKGGDWLCDFLTVARAKYLNMAPDEEAFITNSLLIVLSKIFDLNHFYQARVMLRDCLKSLQYQALGLQKHPPGWYSKSGLEAIKVLDRVEPAFYFVEELQQKRGKDCRIIQECSMKKPKFSVIIPIYNAAPYLAECLDSVINQTISDIEIICIEDGSTDDSLSILMSYALKYPNIKVLQQSNSGVSIARNQGIKIAQGEFLHFLDSDDFVRPETYETLYQMMTEQDLDILFFNGERFCEDDALDFEKRLYSKQKKIYPYENSMKTWESGIEYYVNAVSNHFFSTTPCRYGIRKSLLERNNILFLEGIIHEDNFFANECLLLANRVMHINKPFYCRRVRKNSLTTMPKEFRHAYGYFANYCAFYKFLSERKFDINVQSAAVVNLTGMLNGGYNTYKNIENDCQRYYYLALPPQEAALFEQLIHRRYVMDKYANRGKDTSKKLHDSLARENSLKHSISFRAGRAITWVPRKIRGGIRCYKQHGIGYTLKRTCWHITHFK